jgi:hypothetical protein
MRGLRVGRALAIAQFQARASWDTDGQPRRRYIGSASVMRATAPALVSARKAAEPSNPVVAICCFPHMATYRSRASAEEWGRGTARSAQEEVPAATTRTIAFDLEPARSGLLLGRRGDHAGPVRLAPCRTIAIARAVRIGAGTRAAAFVRYRQSRQCRGGCRSRACCRRDLG